MPTLEHYIAAAEVCKNGGTPEHPYDQCTFGRDECGTPCCIHGHACIIAGESIHTLYPDDAQTAGIVIVCFQIYAQNAMDLVAAGVLPVKTIKEVALLLEQAGWPDARILVVISPTYVLRHSVVRNLIAAGWTISRILAANKTDMYLDMSEIEPQPG